MGQMLRDGCSSSKQEDVIEQGKLELCCPLIYITKWHKPFKFCTSADLQRMITSEANM